MFEHLFVDFKLGFDLDLERLAMLVTDLAELAIRGCDIDKNEVSILYFSWRAFQVQFWQLVRHGDELD